MINLETWIGLRYLRSKKRNGYISFISLISIAGISLGVIALIVVLSVMNGFQKDVRAKIFQAAPHMDLGFYSNYAKEPDFNILREIAQANKQVLATTPYVYEQALLANSGEMKGIQIQGIDPSTFAAVTKNTIGFKQDTLDTLAASKFNIVLGKELARDLGVFTGDKVTIVTTDGNATPAGIVPRLKQFTVSGIIDSDIHEVNQITALINLADAQKLFKLSNGSVRLRLMLKDPQNAPELTAKIIPEQYQQAVWARDWSFQNKTYFEAVAMEKKMMFIIMALISAVASFNLVSSLVMTVNEKRTDIAILRTLGLAPSGIMKIFLIQGIIAGLVGTMVGVILGVLLALNIGQILKFFEELTGTSMINAQVYFLDYLPSHVQLSDVTIIAGISLLLAFLATLYPSWRAAKTQPAEALRYE